MYYYNEDDFNLDALSNEELENHLYKELLFYDKEELYKLVHILRKELPKKYLYRVLSKLYRLRTKQTYF